MPEDVTDEQVEAFRKEIRERTERHAAAQGYRLNPNVKALEALIEGLVKRKVRNGDYYCPCRIVTGDDAVDAANVCPCETHEEEIAASGKCHCGLFFAAEV